MTSNKLPPFPYIPGLERTNLEGPSYKCYACPGYKTKLITEFHYHNRSVHKDSTEFKCPICDHILRSNTQVRDHLARMEEKELARCHICRKHEVRTRHDWIEHFKIHKQPVPEEGQRIPCPMCRKTFKLRRSMDHHFAKYHKDEQPVAVAPPAPRPRQAVAVAATIHPRCIIVARVWRPWEPNFFRDVQIEMP